MSEYDLPENLLEAEELDVVEIGGSARDPAWETPLDLTRRTFGKLLGAGLLITVMPGPHTPSQGGRRSAGIPVAARIHLGADGTISVMTGKIEEGQGARAEISQAAAEELRVGVERIRLIMADTDLVPDDGITAGSRTTPRTVPAVRRGAATARELLARLAAERFGVERDALAVRDGAITDTGTQRSITYAALAGTEDLAATFATAVPAEVTLTPVSGWRAMGSSTARPNARDLVTGAHRYPSDVVRPGMLYGKVLRPPAYGARLESIDLSLARAMEDVVCVQEAGFVGFAAPTTFRAAEALQVAAATARWETPAGPTPSSETVHAHLEANARPGRRSRSERHGSLEDGLAAAAKILEATYRIAYVQHAPMEPRAAVAEWQEGKLRVWAGIDGPQRIQGDLARAFDLAREQVRVIVPDMGGGFGGKHTGEAAEEAARLARAAGRPVAVRWTRAEEFTWAYFRPAAVIACRAGLATDGALTAWEFRNINAGGSGIRTPYRTGSRNIVALASDSPLRQGAYRCLAATGNNFARESFIDELAAAAGVDPLAYRLAHLEDERIRKVLETAAERFDWASRSKVESADVGVGLACGTEKNSVVAACVEVSVDRRRGRIRVNEVCEAFECGPIVNPANLVSQIQGCIVMGLGPALREEMHFENGRILNAGFAGYRVPRFADVPRIDVHLVPREDIPSAGGGETPIIAVAPAIANAICRLTGVRLRSMPFCGELLRKD